MSGPRRLIARVLRHTAAEDGITIIFALALLTIGLAVGAAALAETLSSRSHTNLDARLRRALQAADYGVQAVLYRENQINLDSLDLTGGPGAVGKLPVCVVPKVSGGKVTEWSTVAPEAGGACPSGGWFAVGNHDYYEAEFVPSERVQSGSSAITFFEPKVVAIGVDDNGITGDPSRRVYARVEANLGPIEPFKALEANNDLTFKVTTATTFNGTARAAHNVIFKGEGFLANTFLGTNLLGGEKLIGPPTIEYGCKAEGIGLFAPSVIVIPGGEAMVKRVPPPGQDPECLKRFFKRGPISITPSKPNCASPCTSLPGYNEENNEIFIKKEETLTLTPGNDYVFCSLVTNGPVTLAAGTTNESLPVRIFIDGPKSSRCEKFKEHEGLKKGETVKAGSFKATQGVGGLVGGLAKTLSPTQLQIYMVGDGTNGGTTFTSEKSTANAFFLYAPQTNVSMSSSLSFAGFLLGYDVTVSTVLYTQDLGLNSYPLSSSTGVFHTSGYTQCPLNGTGGVPVTELKSTVSADTSGC